MIRRMLCLLLLLCLSLSGFAQIKLGGHIADNMVLQQMTTIAVTGKATPHKAIKAITGWGSVYKAKTDKTGGFTIYLKTPKAGGPYTIRFDDGQVLEIKNVLIGEVWLAAGQSNMEMKVKGYDAKQPVLNKEAMVQEASGKPAIRFLTVGNPPAKDPQEDITGNWKETDERSVLEYSAVAYAFASRLYRELNVPIGIIVAANSGTRIESWMSRETLESIRDRFLTLNLPFSKNSPAAMYNAMIAPLAGFKIKGVLWYQGEANRMAPGTYLKQFPAFVSNWRQRWKNASLPFYTVEIAPYTYPEDKDKAYVTAFFRESQQKLSSLVENVGIVSTVDVGSVTALHPPEKAAVGDRLAGLALANTYLKKNVGAASVYRSFYTEGDRAMVQFTNCTGLEVAGKTVSDIEIAGSDQVFYPATAVVQGCKLIVWSGNVSLPRSVRYCFKAYSKGRIYNQYGLPVPPFRTDNWSVMAGKAQ